MSSDIETIKALLQEALTLTNDSEVTKKLTKCKELTTGLETKNKGILSKFCLDGQVAFVTGGGQGIGRAFSHALGEAGCKVAVADIQFDRAEIVTAELKTKGIQSLAIKVDVSNKSDVEAAVKKVIDTFGDLHIGVNNAGIHFNNDSEDVTKSEWDRMMGINLAGVFFCCQAEAKHMLTKRYGKIINIASMCATVSLRPQKQVVYNTSKAGVLHMTKTLGAEWADRGVTVNCISPGYCNTPMIQTPKLKDVIDMWLRNIPMGRLAEVDDLTGALIYLASPLSSYTTGSNLIVDGGFTLW